ncbi:cyclin-like protein interacting with PHO85 [Stygiomarasmius scandens]|uniref:Cyclin-like protein interacting with PHO85 n=1 Tax=Marasmiellus scandens TaxID=2682957 RepID=A0ABR1K511_9AGAR
MLALVHPLTQPRTPSTTRPRHTSRDRKPTPSSSSSLPTSSSSSSARTSLSTSSVSARTPSVPMQTTQLQTPAPATRPDVSPAPAVDIHSYPSADLLRLLASLLTTIAATNDKLDSSSDPSSTTPSHSPIWNTLTSASKSAISTPSSTLTFHARNIPTITLEAYLLRILKYCPTTNEVFLSLLVYFDRMSRLTAEATGRTFVIDSYNIHRLVIAGVTVASKFFSDVFYTNSRYAKVGGLPQAELNQLELQFLLLNDFRLVIPGDEMQRYADQLLLFSNSNSESISGTTTNSIPRSISTPSSSSSSSPPINHAQSTPHNSTTNDLTAPMRNMGAIDAYGGKIPGSSSTLMSSHHRPLAAPVPLTRQPTVVPGSTTNTLVNGSSSRTPSAAKTHIPTNGPQHFFGHTNGDSGSGAGLVYGASSRPSASSSRVEIETDSSEAETEAETETETETETEGGWTTDDEPTIKPAHSSAGSSSSSGDTRSIRSLSVSETSSDAGDDEFEFGDEEEDEDSDGGDTDGEGRETDREMDRDSGQRRNGIGKKATPNEDGMDVEPEGDQTPERSLRAQIDRDGDRDMKDMEKTPERRPFGFGLAMTKKSQSPSQARTIVNGRVPVQVNGHHHHNHIDDRMATSP